MTEGKVLDKIKAKAKELKLNLFVLYLANKDPRVPWYAKLFTLCVVAYAFSPIDLIPDFIPVLGYLDDLVLVPLGITLALKLIPQSVIEDCKEKAKEIQKNGQPKNWVTATLFIAIWILLAVGVAILCYRAFTYLTSNRAISFDGSY
jgi:uncharacterized membrane protein YkvA (DUF1232 family)